MSNDHDSSRPFDWREVAENSGGTLRQRQPKSVSPKRAGLLRILGGAGVILGGIGLFMGWLYLVVRMEIEAGRASVTAAALIMVGACVYGGKLILSGLWQIATGQDRTLSTEESLALAKRCMKWLAAVAACAFATLLVASYVVPDAQPAPDKSPFDLFMLVTLAAFLAALCALLVSAGAYFSARSESDPSGRFSNTSVLCYFFGLFPLILLAAIVTSKFVNK